jgi:hypothetical protein
MARKKARKNFWGGKKAKAPTEPSYVVHYEVWDRGIPRKGSKRLTASKLSEWYHKTVSKPGIDGLRIKSASGGAGGDPLQEIGQLVGVNWTALNNSARRNPGNYAIPTTWPIQYYEWAQKPTTANWTSYPEYSYDQFYRANPRKRSTVENEYTEVRGSFSPMSIDMPDSPYGYEIPGERGRGRKGRIWDCTHRPPATSHYRKRKKDKKKRRKARVFVETHQNPDLTKQQQMVRALVHTIRDLVDEAGSAGVPESTIFLGFESRGIPHRVTKELVDALVSRQLLSRRANVLRRGRRADSSARNNPARSNPWYDDWSTSASYAPAYEQQVYAPAYEQQVYEQPVYAPVPAAEAVAPSIAAPVPVFMTAPPPPPSAAPYKFDAGPSIATASRKPWELPQNAGPYLPEMFPYGQGGRPYEYVFGAPAKKNSGRKKSRKGRGEGDEEIITCRGVFGPHMIRRGDLFGKVEGNLVCLSCYNESLEDLPQYSKNNPRLSAAKLRAKIAELDKLYQYDQIDDETYHRLRSSLVLEPPRRGETIGSRLAAMEKEVAERGSAGLYPHARRIPPQMPWRVTKFLLLQTKKVSDPQALQKGVPLRQAGLGSEFGVPFPTAILPRHLEAAREEMRSWKTPGGPGAPETQKKISHRIAQYIAYGEVLSAMGASRERIDKFIRATKLASYRPGYRKSKSPRRAATSSLHPWSIFGPGGPKVANIPSWARRFPGITVTEREARRGAKAERIRKKKALKKLPKLKGPHASELRRLRAAQLRDQREGWVQAEPEAHWRSQSMQERGDPHADFMYPEGAEAHFRSGMHPKAMQNRGSRGGFVGQERDQLPNWYFLKPGIRKWPVGDPRRGVRDDMHAKEAINYMNRGFGDRSEYPGLIKKLAERYPVEDAANRSIWTLYRKYRDAIDEKMSDRGVKKELPTPQELRHREAARANSGRGRKNRRR